MTIIDGIAERIAAITYADRDAAGEHLGAEIRITFDDGSTLTERVPNALGRGPDRPLPLAALTAKFADCAARALPAVQVDRVQHLLLQLDEMPSLRGVLAALAAPGR